MYDAVIIKKVRMLYQIGALKEICKESTLNLDDAKEDSLRILASIREELIEDLGI